jgi:hypothetical protein
MLDADVIEREDVRVLQGGDCLCLPPETREGRRVIGCFLRQDLDRHVPFEPRVAGAIDLAHPARPERRADLVRAQPRSESLCHKQKATSRPRRVPLVTKRSRARGSQFAGRFMR